MTRLGNAMRATYPAFDESARPAYNTQRNQRGYYQKRMQQKGLPSLSADGKSIQYRPAQGPTLNDVFGPPMQNAVANRSQIAPPTLIGTQPTGTFQNLEGRPDAASFARHMQTGAAGPIVQPATNHYGMRPDGTREVPPVHTIAPTAPQRAIQASLDAPSLADVARRQARPDPFAEGIRQGTEDVRSMMATGTPTGGASPAMAREAFLGGQRIDALGQQQDAFRGGLNNRATNISQASDAQVIDRTGLAPSQGYQSTLGPQLITGLQTGAQREARMEAARQADLAQSRQRYLDTMNQAYREGKSYARGWNPETQRMEREPANPSKGRELRLERFRNRRARMEQRLADQSDALQARRRGMTIDQYRNAKQQDDLRTQMMQGAATGAGGNSVLGTMMAFGPEAAQAQLAQNALTNQSSIADSDRQSREEIARMQAETAALPYSPESREHARSLAELESQGRLSAAELGANATTEAARIEAQVQQARNQILAQQAANENNPTEAEKSRKHEADLLRTQLLGELAANPAAPPGVRQFAQSQIQSTLGETGGGDFVGTLQMPQAYRDAVDSISDKASQQAYATELMQAGDDPNEILRIGRKYGIPPYLLGPQLRAASGSSMAGVHNPTGSFGGELQYGPLSPFGIPLTRLREQQGRLRNYLFGG